MFLIKIGTRLNCAFSFRSFSKAISCLVVVSMLAVSMPAAPRMMVDAFAGVRQVMPSLAMSNGIQPIAPAFDASLPAFDPSPLFAVFSNTLAFAGRIKAVALPSRPAGLENAKLPTIGERLRSEAGFASKSAIAPPPPQPTSVVDFDFDNDGKADIGRWHSANTEFKVKNSNGGSYSTFTVGSMSAVAAPGDFNGDSKTDAAVFSGGTWTYKTSPTATAQTISWGHPETSR